MHKPNSENKETFIATLRQTLLEQDPQQLCNLAAIGAIPEFLVEVINPEIRVTIAQNPHTAPNLLAKLAGDEDASVREAAAANPNTPVDALELLVRDRNLDVRTALVKNPTTPGKAIAQNPNAPASILEQITTSRDLSYPCYRYDSSIGKSLSLERTDHHSLQQLAQNSSQLVQAAASTRLQS